MAASPINRPFRLAVALAVALAGGPLAVAPDPAIAQQRPRLDFDRLAQDRGLSNGTVTALAQDRIGFLWLGTEDGLNRYDGSGFTLFRPVAGDTTSLADAWVTRLALARDGALWVATLRGGLHRYDHRTGRFRRFRSVAGDPATLASDQVNTLVEAGDGTMWVGTSRGLGRLDPATGRVRSHPIPAVADSAVLANDVVALALGPRERLWIGTRMGLFMLDPASGRIERFDRDLGTHLVIALLRDRRGTMWVGTEDELLAIDPETHLVLARHGPSTAARPSPVVGRVLALAEGPDGTIWVGSDGGVAALDPLTDRFVRHAHDPGDRRSLGGSIVRSVLVDRGGVLWAGLESHGVSKHAPAAARFRLIGHEPGAPDALSDGYVRGITEDRRGRLWIATQFGGLNRVDPATGRVVVHRHRPGDPASLPGDNVWAVLEDRRGTFWVGLHRHGLGILDPATGRFRPVPGVPADASVNVLYEDRAGAILVGLEGRGLVELSPVDGRRVRHYGMRFGDTRVLADDDVQAILEDREGVLWVGGAFGLTRLDRRTGRATHHRAAPGRPGALGADFVTNVVEDSRGRVWVATKGGGLARFDRAQEAFTTIGTAEGLPHGFVYGILEDAHGRLWLSTDDGIAMLDPATGAITRYGIEDGLQAREFNRRAHFRSADGTMYLGGINGVNAFRPDELAAAPPPPPVSLLTLVPSGGARRLLVGLPADSAVRLRAEENAFTVTFAALDFTAPAKTRYAYRLEGFDRHWIAAGDRREATYANVPPGRYRLRVTAASAAGVWHPTGAVATIVVARPWWATWWARLLGVAAIVALPVAAVRVRLRAVRRRSRWLEQRVAAQTRDLTDAKARLHDALERERQAARELLEITATVPGAVFQFREGPDGAGAFTFVSEGIDHLLPAGAAASGDPRRRALQLLAAADPADLLAARRAMAAARDALEPWRGEVRLADAAAERWLAVHVHPSRERDGATLWTGVAMDATAARRAEAERAALEATMLQAQKAESLGVLAGGIAHDFNNLLVGVLANVDLVRHRLPTDDGEAAATVDHIRVAALRAAELTQQMLAYAGKGRFVVGPVEVRALVGEMLTLLRSMVPRAVALEFEAAEAPVVVRADATQLRQVVLNLVTNAAEAIGDAAGRIVVRLGVEAALAPEARLLHAAADMPAAGPWAVLEVADDGCGMDAATLDRVFDPFFSTKFTGRGLGLAALLGIVRAHHGGIQVETAPGAGARFRVYFPLAPAGTAVPPALDAAPLMEAAPAGAPGAAPPRRARTRVLLVDDEEVVRQTTARVLRRLEYDVITADDGAAALAAMAAAGDAVDVVVMDVTMPGLDGPAAARELRRRGLEAPIVMMSGYAEDELVAHGAMRDADAFLKKPFVVPELVAVLREVTARTD